MGDLNKCVRCVRYIQDYEELYLAFEYTEELLHEGFDMANVKGGDALCAGCADEIIGQHRKVPQLPWELKSILRILELLKRTMEAHEKECETCSYWIKQDGIERCDEYIRMMIIRCKWGRKYDDATLAMALRKGQ